MDIDMIPEVPFREMLRDDDKFVSIVDMPNRFSPKCSIYSLRT
jgi:hypothetical protein